MWTEQATGKQYTSSDIMTKFILEEDTFDVSVSIFSHTWQVYPMFYQGKIIPSLTRDKTWCRNGK